MTTQTTTTQTPAPAPIDYQKVIKTVLAKIDAEIADAETKQAAAVAKIDTYIFSADGDGTGIAYELATQQSERGRIAASKIIRFAIQDALNHARSEADPLHRLYTDRY